MDSAYTLAATVTSLASLVGVVIVAIFQYRGSERASERTQRVQEEANAVSGFAELTKAQREELSAAKNDAHVARQEAEMARIDARGAQQEAGRARAAAEDCHDAMQRQETLHEDLIAYAVTLQMSVTRLGGPVPDPPESLRPPL
jgi:hypothetical protein